MSGARRFIATTDSAGFSSNETGGFGRLFRLLAVSRYLLWLESSPSSLVISSSSEPSAVFEAAA